MQRRFQLVSFASAAPLVGAISLFVGASALCGCSDLTATGSGAGPVQTAPAVVAEPTPTIELITPARGAFLATGQVLVTGRTEVVPGTESTIRSVRVNGQSVPVEADGTFETLVTCILGLNVIQAEVVDSRGKRGTTSIGCLAGDYRSTSTSVAQAAKIHITDTALSAVGKIVESSLWATDINSLFAGANPLVDSSLLWIDYSVSVDDVRFHDVQAGLDTQLDGIHVLATVVRPVITVTVEANLGLGIRIGPEVVTLTADKVDLRSRIHASARTDDSLNVRLEDTALDFTNFKANTTSGVLSAIERTMRGFIRRKLEGLVVDAVTDTLQPLVDTALAEYLTPTPQQAYNVLGKPFLVDIRMEYVTFGNDAFEIAARFDTPPVVPGNAVGPPQQGSLSTLGSQPQIPVGPGVFVSADDDAINRLLHGFWRNGVLNIDLDDAFLQQNGMSLPINLEVGSLVQFLPELRGVMPDETPLAIRIRPLLPPIVTFAGTTDLVQLQAGELGIDIMVDRGNGFETLLSAHAHATMGLTVEMTSDGLSVSTASYPTIIFDIDGEPIVEFDNRRLEVMLSVVMTPLIPQLLNDAKVIKIPHLQSLTVFNAQAFSDGPQKEHLTVTGEMSR